MNNIYLFANFPGIGNNRVIFTVPLICAMVPLEMLGFVRIRNCPLVSTLHRPRTDYQSQLHCWSKEDVVRSHHTPSLQILSDKSKKYGVFSKQVYVFKCKFLFYLSSFHLILDGTFLRSLSLFCYHYKSVFSCPFAIFTKLHGPAEPHVCNLW